MFGLRLTRSEVILYHAIGMMIRHYDLSPAVSVVRILEPRKEIVIDYLVRRDT
jgi:hypothetical protein